MSTNIQNHIENICGKKPPPRELLSRGALALWPNPLRLLTAVQIGSVRFDTAPGWSKLQRLGFEPGLFQTQAGRIPLRQGRN